MRTALAVAVADTPGDSLGCVECWVTCFFNHAVAADTLLSSSSDGRAEWRQRSTLCDCRRQFGRGRIPATNS